MQLLKPLIENDGVIARHNMPCAIFHNKSAVIDCADNVFHPSWAAQREGWRLVRATNWVQRLALSICWASK